VERGLELAFVRKASRSQIVEAFLNRLAKEWHKRDREGKNKLQEE
jgi:hypothetical protein